MIRQRIEDLMLRPSRRTAFLLIAIIYIGAWLLWISEGKDTVGFLVLVLVTLPPIYLTMLISIQDKEREVELADLEEILNDIHKQSLDDSDSPQEKEELMDQVRQAQERWAKRIREIIKRHLHS